MHDLSMKLVKEREQGQCASPSSARALRKLKASSTDLVRLSTTTNLLSFHLSSLHQPPRNQHGKIPRMSLSLSRYRSSEQATHTTLFFAHSQGKKRGAKKDDWAKPKPETSGPPKEIRSDWNTIVPTNAGFEAYYKVRQREWVKEDASSTWTDGQDRRADLTRHV